MKIGPKNPFKLCAAILAFTLLLIILPTSTEAAKAVIFVPTEVYFDDSNRLTLVGQFQNTGNEFISRVQGFIPVVYLDDEMMAADTFSFQVNLQPGYYIEVVMKLNASYKKFSNWYVKWDTFYVY